MGGIPGPQPLIAALDGEVQRIVGFHICTFWDFFRFKILSSICLVQRDSDRDCLRFKRLQM